MSAAVRDMCAGDVTLAGEGVNQDDGRRRAFKAALVRRLVEQCRFDAVVFEGSSYDVPGLDGRRRQGGPVTRAMLSSVTGGP